MHNNQMLSRMIRVFVAGVVSVVLFAQPSTAWAQAGPNLVISMSHTGNFIVGENGVFTIVVSNIGGTATSGQMDVGQLYESSIYSSPFTFVSAVGTGWACQYEHLGLFLEELDCRNPGVIAAGASAAPITLTVDPCCSGTFTTYVSVSDASDRIAVNTSDVTTVLAAVPTLPQWAMIALTVLLAFAGFVAMRRRMT
jgi:hypothetical protein